MANKFRFANKPKVELFLNLKDTNVDRDEETAENKLMRSGARVAGAMICFFELGRGENGAAAISISVSRVVADSRSAEFPIRTRWGTTT